MSGELRSQIYDNLNLRETEDLLQIWQTNDRVEWSDVAFDVIREILKNRGVEIPSQEEPIYEYVKQDSKNKPDSWEEKILDDENQPSLYDPLEVLYLKDYINIAANAVIVITILTNVADFILGARSSQSPIFYLNAYFWFGLIFFVPKTVLEIIVVYFPLKAIIYILKILMEMEFNSRKRNPLVE